MSSANLELVRSIYADWERGDFSRADWAHPEIEFVNADGPTPGSWIGLAQMTEGSGDYLSEWDEYRLKAEEYRELEDERVLVLFRREGRGRTSGLQLGEMRTEGAGLLHIRDGRVTRIIFYFDRDRALADLGVEE